MQKLRNDELGRPGLQDIQSVNRVNIHLVLDNVRSAQNAGSVFRTADAFLCGQIHLCGITAQPPQKDLLKTALGATESVPWKYWEKTTDAVRFLKEEGFRIYAVEQVRGSTALQLLASSDEKTAFIFGHEMDGVSQEVIDLCDGCVEIPQAGIKHSLNVSVCAGIVCWEMYKHTLTFR